MPYVVQDLGHSLLVVSNRGFDIWVRAPYLGKISFDIYGNEVKGNEQFMQAAFGEIRKLAERLGIPTPDRHERHCHLALNWRIGGVGAQEVLQKLAELFDSTELIEAVMQKQ